MAGLRAALSADLPADLFADADDQAAYMTDWRGTTTGVAAAVVLPRTTADVQAIVRAATAAGVAIIPQGGNTSMVAGAVPIPAAGGPDGAAARPVIILSLHRMARILASDREGLSMQVEAGAILQHVHEAAAAIDCTFPLSLGAKGSATIGGLVATNAGGTQVLRHGNMRQLVLGLEAVLPDGAVLNQLTALRKDNSGYDVKQLLIGAEGTLGIVTRVSLKLAPEPAERAVGWVGTDSIAHALAVLARLRHGAGEIVESFELISAEAHDLVVAHTGGRSPLAGSHNWHMLVELAGPRQQLESLLAAAIAAGEAEDATVATSLAQGRALWALRETIPEAERREGRSVKCDIAVAVADMAAFHAEMVGELARAFPGARPFVFGHLGDGNLHWNIRPPVGQADWAATLGDAARRLVHEVTTRWHGSISAEHGIGQAKVADFLDLVDPVKLSVMRAVKQALDPGDLMNPGKIFGASGGLP